MPVSLQSDPVGGDQRRDGGVSEGVTAVDSADGESAGLGLLAPPQTAKVTLEVPEGKEVQPQKSIQTPYTPTRAEMAEHRANGHLPYRPWCPDCVEGFGREWGHRGHKAQRSHRQRVQREQRDPPNLYAKHTCQSNCQYIR